jgi:hypothetical protein
MQIVGTFSWKWHTHRVITHSFYVAGSLPAESLHAIKSVRQYLENTASVLLRAARQAP